MKRVVVVGVLLASLLVGTVAGSGPVSSGLIVPTFSDVPAGAPFYEEIEWVADEGIASGFPDGTFRPADPVSRQAMAAFVYRLENGPDPAAACVEPPFNDVPVEAPFCGEIAWLAATGLTMGFPDGTFRPADPVSRQAMAAFLYRLLGSAEGADPGCAVAPFSDVPVGHPFCGEIAWLDGEGIVGGYDDGTYRPAIVVSRQAMAAFLFRVGHLPVPPVAGGAWTDQPPETPDDGSPYLADVSCPAEDFCMAAGSLIEVWDGADWTVLAVPTGFDGSDAVSCSSSTWCVLAFIDDQGDGDVYQRVHTWDGTVFTDAQLSLADSESSIDVSCVASGLCMVANHLGDFATWNGTGWSTPGDDPALNLPITCTSSTFCVGQSWFGRGGAVHWNGTTWTVHDFFADADGAKPSFIMHGIDCPAADDCLAVGRLHVIEIGAPGSPAAFRWDGTTWSPVPVLLAGEGALDHVACGSSGECLAIGHLERGDPAVVERMALAWDGTRWHPAPPPPGATTASYAALDCVPHQCLAVGNVPGGPPGTGPIAASYAWEPPAP